MNPERWQKVKGVLAEVMEADPAQRGACLDRSCAGDDSLRREVEILLQHESGASSRFLNQTALSEVSAALLSPEQSSVIGKQFGAYKTVTQIGLGGMGEVYRAYRSDDEYRKEVALKVVRAGQDSGFTVTRFRNERQILATLEHPNIARLLDGGTSEDGTPYLVMELVEGQPVTEYCDTNKLSIRDRLKIFMQVCAAVQYAHQRLIIHRDIKPSNILVTHDGTPKLLDFGIAKILDADAGPGKPDQTLTLFRALTPQYASPEQVRGEPITTASDVYSLGVVLYELLTGKAPYPSTGSYQDTARAVCEFEPRRPSTVLSPDDSSPASNYGFLETALSVVSGAHRNELKGDLDNIALMALRKEPQRRYVSVEQFAEDIRRYLANLPVLARKDTAGYRASKFVLRHKAGVTAAAAIVLTVAVGFVITIREARIAQRRFNDVRSLANSLIFDVHDSIKDLPGSTPAKKIIVDHAVRYLNDLAHESSGDIGLQRELATAFEKLGSVQGDFLENNLGDSQGTLASYKKALELRKEVDRRSRDLNDHLAVATGYRLVAHQQWANGDTRDARDSIQHAIALSNDLSKQEPSNMKILYELGFDYEVSGTIGYPGDPQERQKQAEDYKKALASDEVFLAHTPDDIRTIFGYTVDLSELGKVQETFDPQAALANYEKALAMDLHLTKLSNETRYRRSVGIDYLTISSVYDDLGEYAKAAENSKKDLEIQLDVVRADPKNVLLQRSLAIAYVNTAGTDSRAGNIREALDFSSKGLELMRQLISSTPEQGYLRRTYADMVAARGSILLAAKQNAAAINEFENARSIYVSLFKPNSAAYHASSAACDVKLGEVSIAAGQDRTAETYFHRALDTVSPLIANDPPDIDALYAAADAYAGLGTVSVRKAKKLSAIAQQKQTWGAARSWYEKSQSTWQRIDHPNHMAPNGFQAGDPATIKKQLDLVDRALSSFR